MGQQASSSFQVEGTVAPGYESVRKMFEHNFRRGAEESAQLCVYVGEEKVVDLWGSLTNPDYNGDTLTTVFSSTKSITAIAMASLVDQGLMNYDDKISQHWPEFAQNGKENITVADLMRHEAGLAGLDTPVPLPSLLTENIKKNEVGSILEKSTPKYPEDQKREYHAVTRGWIANEIFRRLDKRQRTLKEYLSETVAEPHNLDVYIGSSLAKNCTYEPGKDIPFSTVIKDSFKTDGAVDINFLELVKLLNTFRKLTSSMDTRPTIAPYKDLDMKKIGALFNEDIVRQGETSSANGHCSARGLATLAAFMANKGSFKGVQIMSTATWETMHSNPTHAKSLVINTNFTQGGVCKFGDYGEGRKGYYGWFGYGGSVFQWDPELKIGFAFTPTLLHYLDIENGRGKRLQEEVTKCVRKLQQ